MRERLSKMIFDAYCQCEWGEKFCDQVADRLLANGVIVLPVKIGDPLWCVTQVPGEFAEIRKGTVTSLVLDTGFYFYAGYESCPCPILHSPAELGEIVFLSEREAWEEVIRRMSL